MNRVAAQAFKLRGRIGIGRVSFAAGHGQHRDVRSTARVCSIQKALHEAVWTGSAADDKQRTLRAIGVIRSRLGF